MTTEERFRAAVNVITNLPKNGSYQPSNDLKLKFYAYFKQATEGPNCSPKPSFWDIVKRAKWEAWSKLADMSAEDAMNAYVEELNKIVETMSYTENVADFLSSLESFYARVPLEELEMCIGPALMKVRSAPGSPFSSTPLDSREASPLRSQSAPETMLHKKVPPDQEEDNYEEEDLDDEEDFYVDSMETMPVRETRQRTSELGNQQVVANGHSVQPGGKQTYFEESSTDILMRTVVTLRREMTELNETIRKIEDKQLAMTRRSRKLFGNMTKETVLFILCWPVITHFLILWLYTTRRKPQHYL